MLLFKHNNIQNDDKYCKNWPLNVSQSLWAHQSMWDIFQASLQPHSLSPAHSNVAHSCTVTVHRHQSINPSQSHIPQSNPSQSLCIQQKTVKCSDKQTKIYHRLQVLSHEKLSYHRRNVWRSTLVSSCYVWRDSKVSISKNTIKVIQGHWQWCHSIGHKWFSICLAWQLCLPGTVCHPWTSTCYCQPMPTKFEVSISTHYEDMKGDTKHRKWGGFG